jgi:hypothetical protein
MLSNTTTLEMMVRPYLIEERKSMTIRSLKVFLTVTCGSGKALSPYEVECLVDSLDPDKDGWITWAEIERELAM